MSARRLPRRNQIYLAAEELSELSVSWFLMFGAKETAISRWHQSRAGGRFIAYFPKAQRLFWVCSISIQKLFGVGPYFKVHLFFK